MKKVIFYLAIGLVLCNIDAYSQNISGRVTVSGFSNGATLKEQTPVQLFKSFKENKYKIGFSFNGKGVESDDIVLFDMKTTVKKNGRVIGSSTRSGWPWIPGDMFMPAEAFDFIPMLQKDSPRMKGSKMNRMAGSYEILLEMIVSAGQEIKGSVRPATLSFKF